MEKPVTFFNPENVDSLEHLEDDFSSEQNSINFSNENPSLNTKICENDPGKSECIGNISTIVGLEEESNMSSVSLNSQGELPLDSNPGLLICKL